MENNRLPKLALQCQPHGKRDIGRPRRRWREQHQKANKLRKTALTAVNLQLGLTIPVKIVIPVFRYF
jgi:hypothetical protein